MARLPLFPVGARRLQHLLRGISLDTAGVSVQITNLGKKPQQGCRSSQGRAVWEQLTLVFFLVLSHTKQVQHPWCRVQEISVGLWASLPVFSF